MVKFVIGHIFLGIGLLIIIRLNYFGLNYGEGD